MHSRLGKLTGTAVAVTLVASLPAGSAALAGTAPRSVKVVRAAAQPLAAPAAASSAIAAAVDPEFTLCARTGTAMMPDGATPTIWGFALDTGAGCGAAQLPGPQIELKGRELDDCWCAVHLSPPPQVYANSSGFLLTPEDPSR